MKRHLKSRSGRSGRSGKSGKSGAPGNPGRSGRPGASGGPGTSGSKPIRTKAFLLQMVHALLVGTLSKLEGPATAKACAESFESSVLEHADWPSHSRCELEPDVDNTSLHLLVSCHAVSLPVALAMSWICRLLGNYDGVLTDLGWSQWPLQPGQITLAGTQAAFRKLYLSNACPRMRLNQWKNYRRHMGQSTEGFDQRLTAAQAFHRLSQARAWTNAARKKIDHKVLEEDLHVYDPFLRKLVLHDIWLSHGRGEDS